MFPISRLRTESAFGDQLHPSGPWTQALLPDMGQPGIAAFTNSFLGNWSAGQTHEGLNGIPWSASRSKRRSRTAFTQQQLSIFEATFVHTPYPDITVRENLAHQTSLQESKIQVWFKNRRAKQRKILKLRAFPLVPKEESCEKSYESLDAKEVNDCSPAAKDAALSSPSKRVNVLRDPTKRGSPKSPAHNRMAMLDPIPIRLPDVAQTTNPIVCNPPPCLADADKTSNSPSLQQLHGDVISTCYAATAQPCFPQHHQPNAYGLQNQAFPMPQYSGASPQMPMPMPVMTPETLAVLHANYLQSSANAILRQQSRSNSDPA